MSCTARTISCPSTRAKVLSRCAANIPSALATANLDQATPGDRLILAMETASLQIYRRIAIREALETAKATFATAELLPQY